MSKFQLDNFISKTENIEKSDPFPDFIESELKDNLIGWLSRATDKQSKSLNVVLEIYHEITSKIENKIDLKINERKIILSRVAEIAGVDKSNLTERRTPELCALVHELNIELQRLWKLTSRKSKTTQLTKKELAQELTRVKRELANEKDKNIGKILTDLLNNSIYSEKKTLADKNAQLENEVIELQKQNAQLKVLLKSHNLKIVKN
ncbi:hypothetical protein [Alteromonas australica]|uniref:hypothetical protein n=1 Tax=Alteromonas australica TaxID=589873 RepID=UPI0035C86D64|tara:strand:- start:16 stop:633 length:618 start_codon:yes stop_codon:yes gene_type:complete